MNTSTPTVINTDAFRLVNSLGYCRCCGDELKSTAVVFGHFEANAIVICQKCISTARSMLQKSNGLDDSEKIEADNFQLRAALAPLLLLMADIRKAIKETEPSLWAQRISALENSFERKDSEKYYSLVNRLVSGTLEVRGAFFEMLLPDGVNPPMTADFDRELLGEKDINPDRWQL